MSFTRHAVPQSQVGTSLSGLPSEQCTAQMRVPCWGWLCCDSRACGVLSVGSLSGSSVVCVWSLFHVSSCRVWVSVLPILSVSSLACLVCPVTSSCLILSYPAHPDPTHTATHADSRPVPVAASVPIGGRDCACNIASYPLTVTNHRAPSAPHTASATPPFNLHSTYPVVTCLSSLIVEWMD